MGAVLFLVGLVVVILARTLSADFQRYAHERDDPDGDRDFTDESGWKQVRPGAGIAAAASQERWLTACCLVRDAGDHGIR